MSWNHRVIRTVEQDGTEFLQIHEVYYNDEDGSLRSYTENGISVGGENLDELRWTLDRMRDALNKPILAPADFGI